jgi:arginyl-tRNA synthetase
MSDLHETLKKRFEDAIRAAFRPAPLIGPNWLRAFPNGKPADFRFFGVPKLAKAQGAPPEAILKTLMKQVSLAGLPVDVKLNGYYIDLFRQS